jgi:hypothetical protein
MVSRAQHCLAAAKINPEKAHKLLEHKMAAEWLRLANEFGGQPRKLPE